MSVSVVFTVCSIHIFLAIRFDVPSYPSVIVVSRDDSKVDKQALSPTHIQPFE